jgi:hypothetical protein
LLDRDLSQAPATGFLAGVFSPASKPVRASGAAIQLTGEPGAMVYLLPPATSGSQRRTYQGRVRKLCVDGIITRFEGFDVDGERFTQLFGMPWPKPPPP